jgi:type I restriction enzyme S subunit
MVPSLKKRTMATHKLNNGWINVTFGDVVRLVRDRVDPKHTELERYVAGEHMDSQDLRIRRWGLIGDGYLGPAFHMRFKPGHVLYGSRRTYLRKVAVADFEGITANTTFVLESKEPKVLLPELLPFVMSTESFNEHSVKQSKGSVNPYVNFSDLAWYKFVLPPLEMQRKIFLTLFHSNAYGEALRQLVDAHMGVRRALIDGLTENERLPTRTIGDLCEMQNGRPFPRKEYARSGIRLLRPGNLDQSGYLRWDSSKTVFLSEKWEQAAPEFLIGPGDVLMNLTAQSLEDGFMGRVCLAGDDDSSLLNQRIGRFRKWSSSVLPEFIFRVFQSSRFQRHAIEMCEGSKVKHIFWPYISSYILRLPTLEEQKGIVDTLGEVDDLLALLKERVKSHSALHQQLIEEVFGPEAEKALGRKTRL